jgi:hypothetical protein
MKQSITNPRHQKLMRDSHPKRVRIAMGFNTQKMKNAILAAYPLGCSSSQMQFLPDLEFEFWAGLNKPSTPLHPKRNACLMVSTPMTGWLGPFFFRSLCIARILRGCLHNGSASIKACSSSSGAGCCPYQSCSSDSLHTVNLTYPKHSSLTPTSTAFLCTDCLR